MDLSVFFAVPLPLNPADYLGDVTVRCGNGKDRVAGANRLILGLFSDVARARLRHVPSNGELDLDCLGAPAVRRVLAYLQRGTVALRAPDETAEFLRAARFLRIKGLEDEPDDDMSDDDDVSDADTVILEEDSACCCDDFDDDDDCENEVGTKCDSRSNESIAGGGRSVCHASRPRANDDDGGDTISFSPDVWNRCRRPRFVGPTNRRSAPKPRSIKCMRSVSY